VALRHVPDGSEQSDTWNPMGVFTSDLLRCGALLHRAAGCVGFAAYLKTPHRNATQSTASGVNGPLQLVYSTPVAMRQTARNGEDRHADHH